MRPEPETRVTPHSFEAEMALLGSILHNNAAYHRVSETVASVHFADPLHRKIFVHPGGCNHPRRDLEILIGLPGITCKDVDLVCDVRRLAEGAFVEMSMLDGQPGAEDPPLLDDVAAVVDERVLAVAKPAKLAVPAADEERAAEVGLQVGDCRQ